MALAFGWKSYADTDLPVSDFFNGDFTISAWVMLQYPWSLLGAVVASSTTNEFYAGQGHGNWDYAQHGLEQPNLTMRCGPRPLATAIPGLRPDALKWRHFALVREADSLRLFWNGAVVSTLPVQAVPAGRLRFGALASTTTFTTESQQQFFGLLDNIVVFTRAFDPGEVDSIASVRRRLYGTEPGFLAGWFLNRTWSGVGSPPPVILERPLNLVGNVRSLAVTASDSDSDRIPQPYWHRLQQLPFAEGAVWTVVQGWEGETSHHGGSAFALDLIHRRPRSVRPGEATIPLPQLRLPIVVSAAGGTVVDADLSHSDASRRFLQILHGPAEVCTYIHVRGQGSRVLPAVNQAVSQNEEIAEINVGDQYHLHLAMHDMPDRDKALRNAVTYPVAYSDYFVRNSGEALWTYVPLGIPQQGQDVMRLSPLRTLLYRLVQQLSRAVLTVARRA